MKPSRLFAIVMATAIIIGSQDATMAGPTPTTSGAGKAQAAEATERLVRQVQQSWGEAEWKDYKTRFVSPDGRVVDNGNNNVSHSEGQGYGMVLASFAKDRKGFDDLWGWTSRHLLVRPDGLAAWQWDPRTGAVSDRNNATDGDLLIAWGLVRAATVFSEPRFREQARTIALAIGKSLVVNTSYGPTLLPGAFGFQAADQPDGPIVNLSYFVFPAFDALEAVAPEVDWRRIKETGLKLIAESRFGPLRLPTDWVSLAGKTPQPAKNFPATFGYDAIRIPLYLGWINNPEAQAGRFVALWNDDRKSGPSVVDVKSGMALRPIDGAGFRLIAALSRCLARDQALPRAVIAERDSFYYPATLRLLTMALIEERYPECL